MILRKINTLVMGMCTIVALATACNNAGQNRDKGQSIAKSNGTTSAPIEKLKILKDTTWQGYKVSLLTEGPLIAAHEYIYLRLTSSEGVPAEDVKVDFMPFMDMGMMSHGGPYTPPKEIDKGLYKGAVVFIMANMEGMGKGWMLRTILEKGNAKDTLVFMLPVAEANPVRTVPVGTKDDGRVFVSLLMPDTVKTGEQAIHFQLHKMDKDKFPSLDGYTIEVEPFMPSMGHGAPNNKNATALGDGIYEGIINFSMRGPWEVRVNLLKNGEKVSQEKLVFPIEIK